MLSSNYKQKGYTLIELLVAMAIFTVVLAAPTGFFVSALKSQQKALASQELYDNISYTLEYMSRALRMARKDFSGDCITSNANYLLTNNGHGIKFRNYNGECQEFFLDSSDDRIKEVKDDMILPLTSSNLKIISFDIGESGWSQDDSYQPKVTLFMEVEGTRGSLSELHPKIKIQTSVSQRNLDVKY